MFFFVCYHTLGQLTSSFGGGDCTIGELVHIGLSCVKGKQHSKCSPRDRCVFSELLLVNLHQLLEEEMGSTASNAFHLLDPLPATYS